MGHWDTNCAICGAVAGRYYHEECDLQEGLEATDVDWTRDVRLIGFNEASALLDKTYVSGPSDERGQRTFELRPGAHPNDPVAFGESEIQVYHGAPPVFPAHEICLEEMLSSVLHSEHPELDNSGRLGKWANINIGQLYRCLRDLWPNDWKGHLSSIDYGTIEKRWEGFGKGFMYVEGDQDFIANPVSHIEIDWSQWGLSEAATPVAEASAADQSSGLLELPLDVLYDVFLSLDLESAAALQSTCRMLYHLPFPRWYWLQRVKLDFPFLKDAMEPLWEFPSASLDWRRVHKGIRGITEHNSPTRIPALANRRRIWSICGEIIDEYLAQPDVDGQMELLLGSTYARTSVPRMPVVAFPESLQDEEFVILLGEAPGFVPDGPLEVSASFGDWGLISNMRFRTTSCDALLEDVTFDAQETIQLDGFIERITLVCKETLAREHGNISIGVAGMIFQLAAGDSIGIGNPTPESNGSALFKRVLNIKNGSCLIGIKGSMLPGIAISRLGLIELETEEGAELMVDSADGIQKVIWVREPPSDETCLSRVHMSVRGVPGRWEYVQNLPFVCVGFVKPGWRLEEITIDMRLRGIAVTFKSASGTYTEQFGPRIDERKTLRLSLGEHIVAVGHEGHSSDRPRMIRIRTSSNRQLVCGSPESGETQWFEQLSSYSLSGLYCAWEELSRGSQLTAYGVVYSPCESSTTPIDAELSDEEDAVWEAQPPPSNLGAHGAIAGIDPSAPTNGGRRVSVVSYLDCSRPMGSIRLCFTHSQENSEALSLVGVILQLVDGTTTSTGLTQPGLMDYPEPPTLATSCMCESIEQTTAHWRVEEFHIHGAALSTVRVWSDGEIHALQLTLQNGRVSPVWGDDQKGKLLEIRFGAEHCKGLKLFFWSLHRSIGITDLSVAALQGLK